jgi:hypothetical protein
VNQTIVFNASKSSDPDGDTLQYRWNFTNDLNWDTGWLSTPAANHTYNQSGNYTVVLQVKDTAGNIDLDSTYAIIQSMPATNGTEHTTNQTTSPPSTNETNQSSTDTNNNEQPQQTPGFELLIIIGALLITIMVWRRRRSQ